MTVALETSDAAVTAGAGRSAVRVSARSERLFFSAYVAALIVWIFVGFAPTFFLRGLVRPYWPPLAPIRPIVLVHGIVTTAWVLLFPFQAWLVVSGRRKLHTRLGKWALIAGWVIPALIYLVAADQYHRRINPAQPLTDCVTLALAMALAWGWRWDPQAHKRIMLIILCLLATVAVGRVPILGRDPAVLTWSGRLMPFALSAPLWLWDLKSRSKVHRATLAGGALMSISLLRGLLGPPSAHWAPLFAILPGFGSS